MTVDYDPFGLVGLPEEGGANSPAQSSVPTPMLLQMAPSLMETASEPDGCVAAVGQWHHSASAYLRPATGCGKDEYCTVLVRYEYWTALRTRPVHASAQGSPSTEKAQLRTILYMSSGANRTPSSVQIRHCNQGPKNVRSRSRKVLLNPHQCLRSSSSASPPSIYLYQNLRIHGPDVISASQSQPVVAVSIRGTGHIH